jgi:hypothetical protein
MGEDKKTYWVGSNGFFALYIDVWIEEPGGFLRKKEEF